MYRILISVLFLFFLSSAEAEERSNPDSTFGGARLVFAPPLTDHEWDHEQDRIQFAESLLSGLLSLDCISGEVMVWQYQPGRAWLTRGRLNTPVSIQARGAEVAEIVDNAAAGSTMQSWVWASPRRQIEVRYFCPAKP